MLDLIKRGDPGIEPGTTRFQNGYHTTRLTALAKCFFSTSVINYESKGFRIIKILLKCDRIKDKSVRQRKVAN